MKYSTRHLKLILVALSMVACSKRGEPTLQALSEQTAKSQSITFNGNTAYVISSSGTISQSSSVTKPAGIEKTVDQSIPSITGENLIRNQHLAAFDIANFFPSDKFTTYRLVYRPMNAGSKWKQQTITTNSRKIVLVDLDPETSYEVRVAKVCSPSTTTGYSNLITVKANSHEL